MPSLGDSPPQAPRLLGQVRARLRTMTGSYCITPELMCGSGLRLLECCRLRVKDLDFERSRCRPTPLTGDEPRSLVGPRDDPPGAAPESHGGEK